MTAPPPEPHPTLVGTDWLPAADRRAGVVSVIIPSYNHARFIPQAIRSVAVQTHQDIELIVIDDGSSDGSVGVIMHAIEECGIANAVVEVQDNSGTGAAINRGLMRSTGEFVCILNSDDYYHPKRVAEMLRAMSDAGAEFAFSQVEHVDGSGRPAERGAFVTYQEWLNDVDLQLTTGFALLGWNGMRTSSNFMASASLIERVGLFSDLKIASDWEYALRALAESEPLFIRSDLLFYRVHTGGTLLSRRFTDEEARAEYEQLVSTYFGLVEGPVPTNKLAPGPVSWPDEFEPFLRSADLLQRRSYVQFPSLWDQWRDRVARPDDPLIPPEELITLVGGGGPAGFREVGTEFRIRMILAGLRPDHQILDIGCGSGRIAVALVDYLTEQGSYSGFDIVDEAISWCQREITPRHPNFTFDLVDVQSSLYRPDGATTAVDHTFRYADDSFDFVTLTSVFTHLLPDAVDAYAAEIARVLKPGGRCFATFFLGNRASYEALDRGITKLSFPSHHGVYRTLSEGPVEWAVCHDESSILAALERHGLRLAEPIQYGKWADAESPHSLQDLAVFDLEAPEPPPGRTGLQLVCVTHRPALYQRYVGRNEFARRHPTVRYDNTVENVPLPVRYNQFIETEMDDGWVAFIHHDFEFREDPLPVLEGLSREHIYGVVGAQLVDHGRYVFVGTPGKSPVRWDRGAARTAELVGFVRCRKKYSPDRFVGQPFEQPMPVDTVDCCCIVVHSSLIRRHGLRFDERLEWHLYAEDFSLGARAEHGIETWVFPIDSGHWGKSTTAAAGFVEAEELLIAKHGTNFASTCYQPPEVYRYREIQALRGFHATY